MSLVEISDAALCRSYVATAPDARTPLNAMRIEAVLFPFIDLIELATNVIAVQGSNATAATLAKAMQELVAAQEELDAQGWRNLPAGADPNSTPVWLNPDRLAAALDAADRACAPLLGREF